MMSRRLLAAFFIGAGVNHFVMARACCWEPRGARPGSL